MERRRVIRGMLITGGFVVLLVLILLRVFFLGVYYVDSHSMEPTIHGAPEGGESVLVRYGDWDFQRHDLIVVLPEGLEEPRVKRLVGLPREKLQIVQGDLVVDEHRLAPEGVHPPFANIFDSRKHSLEESFLWREGDDSPWTEELESWRLDARFLRANSDQGLMTYQPNIQDQYRDKDGELVEGRVQVGDLAFGCEFRLGEPAAKLRFGLSEQGDRFEFQLVPGEGGGAELRLERRSAGDPPEVLVRKLWGLPAEPWNRLRFWNRDNHLVVELNGVRELTFSYERNVPHPLDSLHEGRSPGHRVWFGGEEGLADFRHIRISRDLHYTSRGKFATRQPLELGPDEIFVLGDNSSKSRDSRDWGPLKLETVIGRPIFVLRPLGRSRWLR